jgi:uncharacterized damage-inducible protein DinB
MSTTKQIAARMTANAAENLKINLEAMPADKREWRPLDAGRSALSLIQECAVINGFFARILHEGKAPEMKWEEYQAACAQLDTADKALSALMASTAELTAAIESVPEERLADEVTMPFHEGMVMTMEQIMFAAYWNMTYHHGQLAYIQTLYGDYEMHG